MVSILPSADSLETSVKISFLFTSVNSHWTIESYHRLYFTYSVRVYQWEMTKRQNILDFHYAFGCVTVSVKNMRIGLYGVCVCVCMSTCSGTWMITMISSGHWIIHVTCSFESSTLYPFHSMEGMRCSLTR